MVYEYMPSGVCAKKIKFEVNDDIVSNVEFVSGCDGNGKAVGALCEGMRADEVCEKLRGITCGRKTTSCAAELAKALDKRSMP
ncbi:MAG: TIGR03905 family TSCPD domain-containing protein [Eubacterium sp.]|jgi:uncharacterized protein (TIGR03905 family)|nr:TIGR03905 family TSCPD domain-containing protein [Eubacterium sp.]